MKTSTVPPFAPNSSFPSRKRSPRYARSRALYPFAWRTPVLTVPGLGGSGPGHWQTLWEARFSDVRRIVQEDFNAPLLDVWGERIAAAVGACAIPPVIVAHSFGCLALAYAVVTQGARPAAVFLVAPADPSRFDVPEHLVAKPLGLPTTVVASTNDPWLKFMTAGTLAKRWNARFASVGACGHINVASGHGEWPAGLALLKDLAERIAARQVPTFNVCSRHGDGSVSANV